MSEALLDLFTRNGIVSAYPGAKRWAVGQPLMINPYAQIEPYAHFFDGQVIPRNFGAFSYTHSQMDLAASVGRYCSISLGVQLMGSGHPTEWAATASYFYSPQYFAGFGRYFADRALSPPAPASFEDGPRWVKIGHDVWIGAQAMIKRGVTIGDGAVVGTRSLVTRDVPPYAIVAGQPARVLRYRFSEPLIERFQRVRWWRFGPEVIGAHDLAQPEAFLDAIEASEARGAQPLALTPLRGADLIAIAG